VDAYLAVVSKREVRDCEIRPIAEPVLIRVLEAARATGSSRNRQPWRFILVSDPGRLRELSKSVAQPANLVRCRAAIVLALTNPKATFDAGRAAQNLMIAAWNDGVGSCPNTVIDQPAAKKVLALPDDMVVAIIISLGYPAPGQPRPRPDRDAAGVLSRIDRLPLAELAHRESYGASVISR